MEDMERLRTRPLCDALTKKERRKLHLDISLTIRPATHRGPPVNLGEEKHGKLSAEVFRSMAEFDLLASASEFWDKYSQPNNIDPDVAERNEKKLLATMYLSIAVRVTTSFKTSAEHAQKYTAYMTAYLELLLKLYPGICLTPNQHRALHVGAGLIRLGPAPGWWMFPFERLIGILQRTNHNFKNG